MNPFRQFLDDREAKKAAAEHQSKRDGAPAAGAESPDAMIEALMGQINARFYQGKNQKTWMRDQKGLMLTLTWPADWLRHRGVTLAVDKYREILVGIIETIEKHGKTTAIRHFPTYLQECVRLYFVHNGEELYYRQKGIRDAMAGALALAKGGGAAERRDLAPDPIEALAAAHRVLATGKRAKKADDVSEAQMGLF